MDITTKILKFEPNRVKRLYTGGFGIDRLRGIEPASDSRFPEDWIASCIEGNTREFVAQGHGLSRCRINGEEFDFSQLLRNYGQDMLGLEHLERYGQNPGVLTKLLDSAVLLPLQVHPDLDCALRYFQSEYGKTEAWIIIATREVNGEKPYLLLGFNEQLDQEVFRSECRDGEFQTALGMLHKFEVEPGDVFVVHGRMPHAIGPGITMVEVMEPTDYVIIPERNCFGVELTSEQRFAGLDCKDALDIFDYTPHSREAVMSRCCPMPEILEQTGTGVLSRIISRRKERFFEAQYLNLSGTWQLDLAEKTFRIGILVRGEAVVHCDDEEMSLHSGNTFFISYATENCCITGQAELIMILPPDYRY